ncbi:MAG: metal ABC transporter permease [Verrucomicrobiae bacterium]|nr:metal ABC transporter permease [Verrucomicrobiae bacterium]
MTWLIEPLQFEFMQRALLASVLIGFTNGFISGYIVLRRLALLTDALSHSLLPGLAVGAIFFGLAPLGLFFGGLVAAVFVALGGMVVARSSRLKDETAISILYVISFALGIILLKYSRSRVDLGHFLFGNILGVSDSDLWISYLTSFLGITLLIANHRPLLLAIFEPNVARSLGVRVSLLNYMLLGIMVLAMIASLQAVGVVLSLALLILPSATIYVVCDSYDGMLWGGGVLGATGSVIGLYVSYWMDLPSGPSIVLVLGAVFLAAYLFSPRYGVFSRVFKTRHRHEESLRRWEHKH